MTHSFSHAIDVQGLRVRDIMSPTVLTAGPADDVRLASQMMLWGAFHHLPVVEDGRLAGIVTDREVRRRRLYDQRERIAIREVMVRDVVTTNPDELVVHAASRMADAHISCLPVIEGGRLVGILTTTDVLSSAARPRWQGEATSGPAQAKVEDVMTEPAHTVTTSTPLAEAIALMVEHDIRHLPVVDDAGVLLGMMSDRDVRTVVGDPVEALCDDSYGAAAELTVEDAMNDLRVISVKAEEPVSVLSWGFADRRVGAVPVVDDHQRVIGIVSYVDLLRRALPR